jgi:hypothetical protein
MEGKAVYKAITAVQADLAKEGLAKDRKNQQQGFMFRGIDDVYGVLSPILSRHGLCILPRVVSRTCDERQAKSGGALYYVAIEAEYDLVAAEDGSMHTVRSVGEAMDSADKATNKAMSAAYKYMAFQTFCITVEGENHDADADTPEQTVPRSQPKAATAQRKPAAAADNGPLATDGQVKAIFGKMYGLDIPRDQMKAKIEKLTGRVGATSDNLTSAEARIVLDALKAEEDRYKAQPQEETDDYQF